MLKSKYKKLIRAFTSGFRWSSLKCVIQVLFDKKGIEKNETTGHYEVVDESGERDGVILESNCLIGDGVAGVQFPAGLESTSFTYFDGTIDQTGNTDVSGQWIIPNLVNVGYARFETVAPFYNIFLFDEGDKFDLFNRVKDGDDATLINASVANWDKNNKFTSIQNEVGYSKGGVVNEDLVVNGTDWIDTNEDGTPDFWEQIGGSTYASIFSIETSNGRAMKVLEDNASNQFFFTTTSNGGLLVLITGKSFELNIKYKSNNSVSLLNSIYQTSYGSLVASPSAFISVKMDIIPTSNQVLLAYLSFRNNADPQEENYIEIDEISLKEVIPSTVLLPAQINSTGNLTGLDAIGNPLQHKGQVRLNTKLYSPCITGDTLGKLFFDASQDGIDFNWRNTVDGVLTLVTYVHSTGWLIPSNFIDYIVFDSGEIYHNDEITGSNIIDYSGLGHDATITGGVLATIRTNAKTAHPWKNINLKNMIDGQYTEDYPNNQILVSDEALTTPIRTDGSGNFVKVPYSVYNDGDGNLDNIVLYNKEPIRQIVTLKPDSGTLFPDCYKKVVDRLKLIWTPWGEWGSL